MGVNYRKANRALQEILSYIKGIENVWNEQYNLKLYDAFFQCDEIVEKELKKARDQGYDIKMDSNDEFYYFCEDSYNQFLEDLGYMGIEDYRKYIGHTSSFYFSDFRDRYTFSANRHLDFESMLRDICGIDLNVTGNYICFPYISDNFTYEDSIDQDYEALKYLISGKALQDIKSYFCDIIKEYEIVTNFKKDQVEVFTDYIRCQIEIEQSSIDFERELERQEREDFCINTACYTFA